MQQTFQSSYLSSMGPYSVDVAVAMLVSAANTELYQLLSQGDTEITVCFVGQPMKLQTITLAELLKRSDNVDPFKLQTTDQNYAADLKKLTAAGFQMGLQVTPGIPPGYATTSFSSDPPLPTALRFTEDGTARLSWLFSQFTIVVNVIGFARYEQVPGDAFTVTVNGSLATESVAVDAAGLPPAVAQRARQLGEDCSDVRRMVVRPNSYDYPECSFGGLASKDKISFMLVRQYFTPVLEQLHATLPPALSYGVLSKANPDHFFPITGAAAALSPYLESGNPLPANPLSTVCYLGNVGSKQPPSPTSFLWNWLEDWKPGQPTGVVAINRTTLAKYFAKELLPYAESNCIAPSAQVTLSGAIPHYSGSFKRGFTPDITYNSSGDSILNMTFSSSSTSGRGLKDCLGKLTLSSSFTLSVSCTGKQITIERRLVFYVWLRKNWDTPRSGNYYDTTITNVYNLEVNSQGQLTAKPPTVTPSDNAADISAGKCEEFWSKINHDISGVTSVGKHFADPFLKEIIPFSVIQDFYFPGGRALTFGDVSFSTYQDLLAKVQYAG